MREERIWTARELDFESHNGKSGFESHNGKLKTYKSESLSYCLII